MVEVQQYPAVFYHDIRFEYNMDEKYQFYLGMDNVFEAARLVGCNRVAYASSLAVSGEQKFYGDRMVTEDDFRHGHVQYAMHKIFNEWQAQDYNEKYGMTITAVRPANVTGPDKVRGSVDHVNIITEPARGNPITFPFKDAMRCPIHVDDIVRANRLALLAEDRIDLRRMKGDIGGDLAGHHLPLLPGRDQIANRLGGTADHRGLRRGHHRHYDVVDAAGHQL